MKKEVEKKEWVDVKLEIPKIMNLLFHSFGNKKQWWEGKLVRPDIEGILERQYKGKPIRTKEQMAESLTKAILGENFES